MEKEEKEKNGERKSRSEGFFLADIKDDLKSFCQ
jgi:hypothetical protein